MKIYPLALALVLSFGCGSRHGGGERVEGSRAAAREKSACRTGPLSPRERALPLPDQLARVEAFLGEYRAATAESRPELVRAFIERQQSRGGFPIVASDGTVVFFYPGKGGEHEVRLAGDFAPRSVGNVYWDPKGLPMLRGADDGAVFFRLLRFERDARLDYRFLIDGVPATDALNPRAHESGVAGGRASELVMPDYALSSAAIPRTDVAKGSLQVLDEEWARPRVTIYLPPGYDATHEYPVVYTADGSAWLRLIELPAILDNLIADDVIAPVIAVMIDAAEDRAAWYSFNPDYLTYLDKVVAYVDRQLSTRADARGRLHIGSSAGGRISLYVGLERPGMFGNVALLSPSLHGPPHYYEPYFSGRKRPDPNLRVWLSAGTYEGSLCEDTRTMERYFEKVGLQTAVVYTHEGHSFGTWRNIAAPMLTHFFATGR